METRIVSLRPVSIAAAMAAGVFALCLGAFAAGNSPLADAAMNGDRVLVQSLLKQKADLNAVQADGATAIQWSAYRDDLEMADLLIAAGANIQLANREGATPLYLASVHGSAPMIEKLLKAGADPNQLGPEGETPLMLAARTGNLDAIRTLLDHHADVNAKDKLRGTTALMWATEQSHPEAVKLLVEHGATVGAQSEFDSRNARNNLANTVKQRLHSSFGVLGKRGPGNDGTPALPDGTAASKDGSAAPKEDAAASKVKEPKHEPAVAPTGATVASNVTVASKTSPASEANAEDDVVSFFRRPAKKDGGGLTPLVYAAREDCMECAKTLVEAGADVNQQTYYGWTPLLVATQNKHYKLGQYFLEQGANPNP